MYLGAVFIFLFVLGLFTVKGGLKWWIIGVSALAVILSWGYHFMAPTKFFFEYAPMYNKFRTVSMILVILQVTVPVLGILAIDRLINMDREKAKKGLLWATIITGGFAALFALIPSLAGSFFGPYDGQLGELATSIREDRISLLRSDAFRSLVFVLLAAGALLLAISQKIKKGWLYASLIVLALIDLWAVDKRYLSEKDFVTDREFTSVLNERFTDKYIHENDTDPDFRVLDLSVDPFNNAYISYHHKTIGGYSPAKMQRYQDLIDRFIRNEMGDVINDLKGAETYDEASSAITYHPVLSMLNTRYFIFDHDMPPLVNPYAQGNCWFASNIVEAEDADDEIAKLKDIDPRRQAIVSKDFIEKNPGLRDIHRGEMKMDSTTVATVANDFASINLTGYAPNKLTYHYSSATPQAAIFSEVYYPGWKATLNGKEIDIFRANWILRGALLPAGDGDITFTFKPESFVKGEKYSLIASSILILLLIAAIVLSLRKKKEQD